MLNFSVDENALYRQPGLAQWYDPSQSTPNEVMAKEYDLAFIGLEGEIGCLVNGAGLAMATMDIIHHYGGAPANFLDVGGGATKEEVAHGFKIILLDPKVKAIFVNIFGGIMDCGVLSARNRGGLHKRSFTRASCGTYGRDKCREWKKDFKRVRLNIITADTMADGAEKAIKAAAGGK